MEIQLGLVDQETGKTIVPPVEVGIDILTEEQKSFMELTSVATNIGQELGRQFRSGDITSDAVNRLVVYVSQLFEPMCARKLSPFEKFWLRDNIFNAAATWLKPD